METIAYEFLRTAISAVRHRGTQKHNIRTRENWLLRRENRKESHKTRFFFCSWRLCVRFAVECGVAADTMRQQSITFKKNGKPRWARGFLFFFRYNRRYAWFPCRRDAIWRFPPQKISIFYIDCGRLLTQFCSFVVFVCRWQGSLVSALATIQIMAIRISIISCGRCWQHSN